MNLAPMLRKQKLRSCFSQPTPREAKLLALEPLSLFVEPQEKNPKMCHLLHSHILILVQCQPLAAHGHAIIQYFSQDLVIYEPLALQHSTRSCDLILGDDASCILSSHSVASVTCLFLLQVNKHSSTTISTFVPLQHILLNKIVFITKCFILDFSVKNNKIIIKYFQHN